MVFGHSIGEPGDDGSSSSPQPLLFLQPRPESSPTITSPTRPSPSQRRSGSELSRTPTRSRPQTSRTPTRSRHPSSGRQASAKHFVALGISPKPESTGGRPHSSRSPMGETRTRLRFPAGPSEAASRGVPASPPGFAPSPVRAPESRASVDGGLSFNERFPPPFGEERLHNWRQEAETVRGQVQGLLRKQKFVGSKDAWRSEHSQTSANNAFHLSTAPVCDAVPVDFDLSGDPALNMEASTTDTPLSAMQIKMEAASHLPYPNKWRSPEASSPPPASQPAIKHEVLGKFEPLFTSAGTSSPPPNALRPTG
ncbi:hypothetical protein CYMTET_30665 [Cymbomonas tetramitiformis]|uniref:Uncharacterized protein n=1 Tax=Cymbomonas tetramitiformis TaxID=36881 RepID=A0AAE0KTZ3_9CHLO|nr:hypothetical protein CYMTET_30665 [Cymbomonas tetramitiformis]